MSGLLILAVIRWARRQQPSRHDPKWGAVEKNVLNVVATYADKRAWCFPGQEELAAATDYSVRAVRLALSRLEEAGYLRRTPRKRRDGSRDTDGIQLLLERDDNPPADAAAERPARERKPTGTPQQANRNPTAAQPESDSGPTTFEESREESTEGSEPNGSAPVPGASPDFKKDLWDRSVRILQRLTRRSEPGCRALIGSWRGLVRDDATIIRTIDDAEAGEVVEAVSWIEARLKRGPKPGFRTASPPATPVSATTISKHQAQAESMAARGEWPVGGTTFVAADSPQGRAWEAYYAGFGVRARWRDCDRAGYGCRMPSALPPDRSAVAA